MIISSVYLYMLLIVLFYRKLSKRLIYTCTTLEYGYHRKGKTHSEFKILNNDK